MGASGISHEILEDFVFEDKHFTYEFDLEKMMEIVQPFIERAVAAIEPALEKSRIPRDAFELVLLAGGSSQLPGLDAALHTVLPGCRLARLPGDTNLAVSRGAALFHGELLAHPSRTSLSARDLSNPNEPVILEATPDLLDEDEIDRLRTAYGIELPKSAPDEMPPLVGIDLGTTTCEVAWRSQLDEEHLPENVANDVLHDAWDDYAFPSVVAFLDGAVHAADLEAWNARSDPSLEDSLFERFKIQDDVHVPLGYLPDGTEVTVERLQTAMLDRLLTRTRAALGRPGIDSAVVTLPAGVTPDKCAVTYRAAKLAGISNVHLLEEPSAAFWYYMALQELGGVERVLVFDWGSGSVDVSVLDISGWVHTESLNPKDSGLYQPFNVLAASGDDTVGGDAIDDAIAAHLRQVFEAEHNVSFEGQCLGLWRLREAATRAEVELSGKAAAAGWRPDRPRLAIQRGLDVGRAPDDSMALFGANVPALARLDDGGTGTPARCHRSCIGLSGAYDAQVAPLPQTVTWGAPGAQGAELTTDAGRAATAIPASMGEACRLGRGGFDPARFLSADFLTCGEYRRAAGCYVASGGWESATRVVGLAARTVGPVEVALLRGDVAAAQGDTNAAASAWSAAGDGCAATRQTVYAIASADFDGASALLAHAGQGPDQDCCRWMIALSKTASTAESFPPAPLGAMVTDTVAALCETLLAAATGSAATTDAPWAVRAWFTGEFAQSLASLTLGTASSAQFRTVLDCLPRAVLLEADSVSDDERRDALLSAHKARPADDDIASALNEAMDLPLDTDWASAVRALPRDLEFQALGGGDSVGASCYTLTRGGKTVMLDCGLNVGDGPTYPRLDSFTGSVDTIVLSHAHLDHCGALPKASSRWPAARIICTDGTRELAAIQYDDMAKHNEQQLGAGVVAETRQRKDRVMRSFVPVDLGRAVPVAGGCKVSLHPAGHLFGASAALLDWDGLRIVYTGDFCCHNQGLVPGMKRLPRADVLICEATYATKEDQSTWAKQVSALVDTVSEVVEAGGVALLPSFALGRSQELVMAIGKAIADGRLPQGANAYLGGMACTVCDRVGKRHMAADGAYASALRQFKYLKHESGFADAILRGSVVVASSGMLTPGSASASILAALRQRIRQGEKLPVTVVRVGHMDEESERHARGGSEPLPGLTYREHPLSAHASSDHIVRVISAVKPKVAILVHWGHAGGQVERQRVFAAQVEEAAGPGTLVRLVNGAAIRPLSLSEAVHEAIQGGARG